MLDQSDCPARRPAEIRLHQRQHPEGGHLSQRRRRLRCESWSIEEQPISFMSRSISVRSWPSARSTPDRPGCGERIEIITADADRLSPERERFKHVGDALDAAVHHNIEAIADGVHNLGELVECRA
jgi:hypothetical protein